MAGIDNMASQYANQYKGKEDDLKKSYGCIRPTGIMQNYGIGMSLYFKFTKTLLVLFFFCALAAAVPMTYYWTTRCLQGIGCLSLSVSFSSSIRVIPVPSQTRSSL